MKHKRTTVFLVLALALALLVPAGLAGAQEGRVGGPKGAVLSEQTISVFDTPVDTQLVDLLTGDDVTLLSATFTGDSRGAGSFIDPWVLEPYNEDPILGIANGVILSSGKVIDAVGPNSVDWTTTEFGLDGDDDLNSLLPPIPDPPPVPVPTTYDATVLEFSFECADSDVVSFYYVFASEEYNEYVNTPFNDVFGFFLNGENIALLPDGVTPVSINTVNNGKSVYNTGLPGEPPISYPAFYINNDRDNGGPFLDIEADGLTVVLGAEANIQPGINTMKLAIADTGDRQWDSWVFIEENSFHCAPLPNHPPVVDAGGPYVGEANVPISLEGTAFDPDGHTLTLPTWSVSDPDKCTFDDPSSYTPELTCTEDGSYKVFLAVSDGELLGGDFAPVGVGNRPPTADPNGPYLGAVSPEAITFDGTGSTDPDGDELTYAWTFGDNSDGTGATPSHEYAAAGIYDVCLTVSDGVVASEEVCTFAVVYDPNDGFVTGGGWIDSPAGAYKADPTLTGKATFGFVARYKKGEDTPMGNTGFQFQSGDLSFSSTGYDWLVVNQAENNAQLKGSGTVNGVSGYQFMVWAGDGEPDTFRIKIWDEASDEIVYDNGVDQAIASGSIVIHVK